MVTYFDPRVEHAGRVTFFQADEESLFLQHAAARSPGVDPSRPSGNAVFMRSFIEQPVRHEGSIDHLMSRQLDIYVFVLRTLDMLQNVFGFHDLVAGQDWTGNLSARASGLVNGQGVSRSLEPAALVFTLFLELEGGDHLFDAACSHWRTLERGTAFLHTREKKKKNCIPIEEVVLMYYYKISTWHTFTRS